MGDAALTTRRASELSRSLTRLRSMVEQGNIEGARAFTRDLERQWPEDARVREWSRVLAPPEAESTGQSTGRGMDREFGWLEEHAHEHPGCWLAVVGDCLVASDADLARVRAALSRERIEGALIHFQPAPPR